MEPLNTCEVSPALVRGASDPPGNRGLRRSLVTQQPRVDVTRAKTCPWSPGCGVTGVGLDTSRWWRVHGSPELLWTLLPLWPSGAWGKRSGVSPQLRQLPYLAPLEGGGFVQSRKSVSARTWLSLSQTPECRLCVFGQPKLSAELREPRAFSLWLVSFSHARVNPPVSLSPL